MIKQGIYAVFCIILFYLMLRGANLINDSIAYLLGCLVGISIGFLIGVTFGFKVDKDEYSDVD